MYIGVNRARKSIVNSQLHNCSIYGRNWTRLNQVKFIIFNCILKQKKLTSYTDVN